MTANGYENGDRDHVTATGHDDLPGEKGTADANPKGQAEASGHPSKRAEQRREYLQAQIVQKGEEATRLYLLQKTQKKIDRKPPADEKSEPEMERDP